MENYPPNSKMPNRKAEEPKRVERVVEGEVIRRKTPKARRWIQNFIGGDVRSVREYMFMDVIIPAIQVMIYDAFTGGLQRTIFPDGSPRHRGRDQGMIGHKAYNLVSSRTRYDRDEPRRDISRQSRSTHTFDEIIIPTRVEAEAVLERLEILCDRYDTASVWDLYEMVGITNNYVDKQWGWTSLRTARVTPTGHGYLLDLPRPQPIE